MEKTALVIEGIPAVLWGPAGERLFIAVHGDQSDKEDAVIGILAEVAAGKGHGVLSFDLPEHGGRKAEPRRCTPQNCVEDLGRIMAYARARAREVSLFGCSLGAYFAMLAYREEPLRQALLLSPVVDMRRIIENIMGWFGVSEARLRREGTVATPVKTLYWDYYRYVAAHPVEWDKPTALLYGAGDELCEAEAVAGFAARTKAQLTVMEAGEHFFHTGAQLAFFQGWLEENLKP